MNKWIERNNYVEDENGNMILIFPDNADSALKQKILKVPKMIEAIYGFILDVDSGRLRTRKTYNNFKSLVEDLVEA